MKCFGTFFYFKKATQEATYHFSLLFIILLFSKEEGNLFSTRYIKIHHKT